MSLQWLSRSLVFNPDYLALCTTEKSFKQELKKRKVKDPVDWISKGANATTHIWECAKSYVIIVCIPIEKKRTIVEIASLLVHEAVHIWRHIKKRIGEDKPSEEFEAYAMQNLTQTLLKAYLGAVNC